MDNNDFDSYDDEEIIVVGDPEDEEFIDEEDSVEENEDEDVEETEEDEEESESYEERSRMMDAYSPSFSSAQDIFRMQKAMAESRAEQRTINKENREKRKQERAEKKQQKEEMKNMSPEERKKKKQELRDEKKQKRKEDLKKKRQDRKDKRKADVKEKIEGLKKKIKIYAILACVIVGGLILIGSVGVIVATIGSVFGGTSSDTDINSVDWDSIDFDSIGIYEGGSTAVVNVALREYYTWVGLGEYGQCEAIKKYINACGSGYRVGEYCAGFVTYALKEAKVYDSIGFKTGNTCNVGKFEPEYMTNATTHPTDGSYIPQPGDIVIYNIDGDYAHVELVESYNPQTKQVNLIGGNTSPYGSVCLSQSPKSNGGYGSVVRKTKQAFNNKWLSHYISYSTPETNTQIEKPVKPAPGGATYYEEE